MLENYHYKTRKDLFTILEWNNEHNIKYLDYHRIYFHGVQNMVLKTHHIINESKLYLEACGTLCR